jgi:hypothetical protein
LRDFVGRRSQRPKVVTASDGTTLLVAAPADGGMSAEMTGRLAVLTGGCLGITAGGQETVVIWPSGTGLASGGNGIVTTTPAPPPGCHADDVWVAGPGSVELTNRSGT